MRMQAARLMMVATLAGLSGQAVADGMDGKMPVICATNEVFDCGPNVDCVKDTPDVVNLPRFIRLDFAAKKAFTKRQDGEERTAEITSQQVADGTVILQGIQLDHAWSLVISQATGDMSLTIAGDAVGFVIFGSCTAL